MRKTLVLVILTTFAICLQNNTLHAQTVKSNLEKAEIKGSVKSCISESYTLKYNDIEPELPADTMNHVYAEKLYNQQGYILQISSSYSMPENLVKQNEYVYSKEKLEKIIFYGQDGKEDANEFFTYDKKGNQTMSDFVSKESAYKQTYFYKYDRNNRLIKEISHYYYEENKYKEVRSENRYDKQGNLTKNKEIESTPNSAKEKCIFSYVYDESGNMVELNIYTPEDKSEYKCISEYNEYGDIIKEICYDDGTPDGEMEVNLYRYKYDNHNNWIKKEQFLVEGDKEILKNVDIREFEYYD